MGGCAEEEYISGGAIGMDIGIYRYRVPIYHFLEVCADILRIMKKVLYVCI